MPAKFVLTKSGKGFQWNLVAVNGRVVASSERYETRRAALAGIESVRKNAAGAVLVEEEEQAPDTAEGRAIQSLTDALTRRRS
jgi:uncharacterized protein YegP (UPF0339 family)